MRVLFLINSSEGLYGFRKELIECLVDNNELYYCAPDDGFVEELDAIGIKRIPVDFNRHGLNPISEIKLLMFYVRMIKNIKPHAVLTYTIKPNVYGGMACGLCGIPYIANITGLGTALENKGVLQHITLLLYKIGLRKATMVFFQNNENKEFMIRKHVISGEYGLLPGSGVNLDKFVLSEYKDDEIVRFYFISRVMKEKGVEEFLSAAEILKKRYNNSEFHVCGYCEQDYSEKLDNMQKNNVIIYHGNVKNIEACYKNASCVVLPTYYPEGLSNVLLESLASGRPIITTNRSGCKEVVEDNVNGFVVRAQDVDDLVEKMKRFLSLSYSDRKQMGINGRKKVEREFSRRIVVERYIEELDKIGV